MEGASDAAKAAGAGRGSRKERWRRQTRSSPSPTAWQVIAEAGATAVIQPGGSVRDEEVIAAADEAGLAMVFTGMRHFRH